MGDKILNEKKVLPYLNLPSRFCNVNHQGTLLEMFLQH